MKLLVQEFLETHSLKELQEQHGVYASFSQSGHKFSLNYDQIEAKEGDTLAQECRGLILACEDGVSLKGQSSVNAQGKLSYDHLSPGKTQILAFPMRRFFNHGQGSAAEIDFSDPKLQILEKLDGTLTIVYYDPIKGDWCVATRSVPEADIPLDNGIFTFRTLFEKAMTETCGLSWSEFVLKLDIGYTYCFELTTPYNRIVVAYPESRVTLLAVRELATLKELDFNKNYVSTHSQIERLRDVVPLVESYSYSSLEETLEWISSLNPMEHEGVVFRSGEDRVKAKNAAYVAFNKIRDVVSSERGIMEVILCERDDDVIPMLPEEIAKNMLKLKAGLQSAIREYDFAYSCLKYAAACVLPDDKKTFAIMVTRDKKLWSAPMFQMYDGKAKNMKDFIARNRKEGSWSNSFLDKMLEIAK